MKPYTLDIQFYLPKQKDYAKIRKIIGQDLKDFLFWNSFDHKTGIVVTIKKEIDNFDSVVPEYQLAKQRVKKRFPVVRLDVMRILCNLIN